MNRIYRVLWSEAQRAWVVASELAKPRGKRNSAARDAAVRVFSRGLSLHLGALASLLALSTSAPAADRYWDANQTAGGWGGTGIWNLSNFNWSPNADGVSGPFNTAWSNTGINPGTLDNAIFGGTSGIVTLGAPITVNTITFSTWGYTIAGTGGNTLTLGGATPTITTNPGVAATISAGVLSSAGFTKAGVGALTLSGANNFGNGGIDVSAGSLTLSGSNTFTGNVNVSTGTSLTLSAANSFTGNINVFGGLTATSDAALGAAGNIVTLSGGGLGATGALSANRQVVIDGSASISGAGVGSALFTGSGTLSVASGVSMSNDANTYTGTTTLNGSGTSGSTVSFTSVRNTGMASSLGASGDIVLQGINSFNDNFVYTGGGDTTNRTFRFTPGSNASVALSNSGTGTLALTGSISLEGGARGIIVSANSADIDLSGVISGTPTTSELILSGGAGRTITLGAANTYSTGTEIATTTAVVSALADIGSNSSFGTGSTNSLIHINNGTLRYTGDGDDTNRTWQVSGASAALQNDGSGGLGLSGAMLLSSGALNLRGSYSGLNTLSSNITGAGGITMNGAGSWVLSGTNDFTGPITVQNGTLRAGSATAFGASGAVTVNGGTLDLAGFDNTFARLDGSGGQVALGGADLTLNVADGITATYSGGITGNGDFYKTGAGTQVLRGVNTYTGSTNLSLGTLELNFTGAGAPASNIIASTSALNISDGTLRVTGVAGSSQTFSGLNIIGGSNRINATNATINFGAVNRTSGLIDFGIGTGATMTVAPGTTLGGWATVNGSDYADVDAMNRIVAFADYDLKDNAATWADNDIVSDTGGTANTQFLGTVSEASGDNVVQLGGLRYSVARNSTVDVATGQTLGVDGAIILGSSVGGTTQTINGGSLRGSAGGVLGIQQSSAGTFTINSTIVDNAGETGLTVVGNGTGVGTGKVVLGNAANTYTGPTWVTRGTLEVGTLANGGAPSSIGMSAADPENLVLEASRLSYTGGNASTDRGLTLMRSGALADNMISVTQAGANLTVGGELVSPDDANLVKEGAGTLTLTNANSSYTGTTTVNGGTLAVTSLGNGGDNSTIGASSSSSSSLVIGNGAEFQYDGGDATSDRGFTLGAGVSGVAFDVSSSTSELTMTGNAVGTNALIKRGAGTLVLSGNNTYNSNTVEAGTLRAGSTTAFGNTAGLMYVNTGARLELGAFSNTVGGLNGSGTVDLGQAGTRLTLNSRVAAFTGTITGAGELSVTGGALQTLDGCNHTYTGATVVSGGTLSTDCIRNGTAASGIGASAAAAGNLVLANSGVLRYTGGSATTNRAFHLSGGWGVIDVTQPGTTLQFTGDVTNASGGGLDKAGPGTLILSGTNTYSATVVRGGTLVAGSAQALGGGVLYIQNGATVDMTGFSNTVWGLSDNSTAGGEILIGARTLTLSGTTAGFAGRITGTTGSLIKNGGGTQFLTGCANSYGGGTTINGGGIDVVCLADGGLNSSIGSSGSEASNLVIGGTSDGVLQYRGTGDSTNRLFTMGRNAYIRNYGTGALNFTSTGQIVQAGAGARTLSLGGTYTGGTNILSPQLGNNGASLVHLIVESGTWRLANTASTYTGVTQINGGATLEVAKLANGSTASSIGAATGVNTNLLILDEGHLRYVGSGDSTNRLFRLGIGTLYIESSGTGAINFTGTGDAMGFHTPGARTLALGGTYTGDNIMGVVIADQNATTGKTTLAKNDAGTWMLTGNNTYTGNTVINDGRLIIGNGGTSGNLGTGEVILAFPTGTLGFNRSDTVNFAGRISGPGIIEQMGEGTTVLTAVNGSGATRISEGTLQVNGALTTGGITFDDDETTALTVNGTVHGNGVPAVITGDGSTNIINVAGSGILTANGDLGGGSDAVSVTGTLATGGAALSLGAGDDTFTLNDGAVISGTGIDGGTAVGADRLQVNNGIDRVFDGTGFSSFERLVKQNTGRLTLTGTQAYSVGTGVEAGTLEVDGTLDTAAVTLADNTTLDVDGTLQAAGGAPTAITGSAGVNTVLVNTGATVNATGDLGGGSDVVTVAGTLNTGSGSLNLGAGDDTFTLNDDAVISGTGIDAGTSTTNDVLVLNNADVLTFDGGTTAGFEQLIKQNGGIATMSGTQSFSAGTAINGGTLDIDGTLNTASVALADGTTLHVDGTVQAGVGTQTTLAGSTGINTVTVNGTLSASGDLGGGADAVTVAGTLDTGASALALGAGDDTLTLNDGAVISGAGVDAGAATTNDALVLNSVLGLTFDGSSTAGFETLRKQNSGTATMTGTQSFAAGTMISGGTLDIDGTLNTTSVDLADGTTLNVDGTVQAGAGTQTTMTGSTGVNTVLVNDGAMLLASGDLGQGNDVLDIAGTLDTGAGTLSLGDGDDSFVVHDGTTVVGTVDGGAGSDTRVYDIDLTADLGALLGFEGLTKSGTGTLNVNGPGASTLADVDVLGGTLNVVSGAAIDGAVTTSVASGATLNIAGSYAGSTGDDTFTVAGTVSGAGIVNLGGGDDVLTLRDGASVTASIDAGAETSSDRVVLDSASALTFDGTNIAGFEALEKQNAGTATLAGTHSYDSAAINGGTLDVDGTLEASSMTLADGTTLNVDGTVRGAAGTQTAITGSTVVDTVVVNDGGTLLASGDLGDGNDVLDVAGTLDTGGGTFSLGAGDDTFVVHDTTEVIGTLDAGAGNDQLNVNVSSGNLVPLGSTTGFESLGKSGLGALEINGASDFIDVQVQAGLLDITASGSIEAQSARVDAGAALNVDGALAFTAGADHFTVGGSVSGGGSIDMLDGDDQLTILDGANLSGLATSLDGGTGNDTLTADIATSATLGGVSNFETLTKSGAGTLNIDGPAGSSFTTVQVQAGVLDVAAASNVTGASSTTVASGATLNVDGAYAGSAGNDTFTVAGTVSGAGSIDLGGGDDILTVRDGASLNVVIDAGAEVGGDRVVLDNTAALSFGGADVTGFEHLEKQNAGTATLTGTHTYDSATIGGGTLDIDGALAADTASLADGTTLNVDGSMQGASGPHAVITGSTGVNTVAVAAGATLAATGDLGDGSDVLDVGGTLDAGGGTFNLGAGDDTFVIHDGTAVTGTVVGGAGLDTRVYDIVTVADVGALQEFEGLTKRNSGTLNINGPATTTDLLEVAVEGGTLNITAAGNVTGVQATTVEAGATLNVDGVYAGSTGNDTFMVAGTVSGAGSIDLGDGEDVLTLHDGALLSAAVNGGNAVGADSVVLDNVSDFTFDGTNVAGFEELVKQNTGTATLVGAHTYDNTAVNGGTLDVDGTLETTAVALADDTTVNIDGTVSAAVATQTAITGTAGVNSVIVNAGSTLLATGNLGDGNDVLNVAGTFDAGAGVFQLGAGDDTFVVHDGTTIIGTIDGGDGLDTRVYDINTTATLGALTNFEGLTKTGTGVLDIQGPGSSDLSHVEVLGGTLDIDASGGIVGITDATVGAGATLNVDGAFDFTAGGDTFNVAGTITGATSINMLDGDDQLTLSEGADLSGLSSPLDGGTGTDTLIADVATTATLGGVESFENLTKEGVGTLNVAASSAFSTVLVDEGLLDVAGGATVEANTATVSEGATLNVAGEFLFTAGADTFTVAGSVTGPGAIEMLDGDDQLTVRDGADLSGLATSLDGGTGSDTLIADITTQATLGGATGFETLIKQGTGAFTIAGPADSMFDTVHVQAGELDVALGALVDPRTTTVDAGATLTVDGTYQGTADDDTFTLSGTLAGSGTVNLLEGDDVLTVNTGSDVTFTGVFDANVASADRFVLAGNGEDTFDAGLIGTVFRNFDEFRKEGTGTWRLTGTGSNDWRVAEGTLIGDTASFGGDIDNAGTVVFDQASDGTYAHVMSGNGTLIKQNTGTLTLTGTHTFSGITQIAAGTLQVDGVLPSAITIDSGATLSGTGRVGSVSALAGSTVAPGAPGLPFGTLTITGDYVGGGTVRINTVLGNETSDTGRLVVQGNVSGTSTVLVNPWSGNGAMTQGDGIEVIQVDGASAPDSFRLGQSVQAGAYDYLLYQGGSSDANDWYLRSELIDPDNPPDDGGPAPAFRAGVPGYVLGHQANLEYGFTALGNLRMRVGDQGRPLGGAGNEETADAWMRVYADELDVAGTRFEAQDQQMTTLQFGTDLYADAGTHFGVMASIGESSAALFDAARAIAGLSTFAGQVRTDAKGAGLYFTHYDANGAYIDVSGQFLHYRNGYRDQSLIDADQRGWGGTIAAEIGAAYALGGSGWHIEPQLQLGYQRLELDDFHDGVSTVSAVEDDALRGRAGLRFFRAPDDWLGMSNVSPYIGLGAQHDFRKAAAVDVGGTAIHDEIPETTGDISIGFTGSVKPGVELHLDVRYQDATEGEKDGLRANFGFRMMF